MKDQTQAVSGIAIEVPKITANLVGVLGDGERNADWIRPLSPRTKFVMGREQAGFFITKAGADELIKVDPLCPVLMRCGRERYLVPVAALAAAIEEIRRHGDYLRDVSFDTRVVDEVRADKKRYDNEVREAERVRMRAARLAVARMGTENEAAGRDRQERVRASVERNKAVHDYYSSIDGEWRGDVDPGL